MMQLMRWRLRSPLIFLPSQMGPHWQFYRAGRLAQSIEGRAKRRIFAIGNYVCQRLLQPIHHWLMAVLRGLPTDGTFNQSAPLLRLVNRKKYFCYDLTAATDRMPLKVLFHTMASMLGSKFASSTVNSTLALHTFEVPFVGCRGKRRRDPDSLISYARDQNVVSFVVGKPLGDLTTPLGPYLRLPTISWCGLQLNACTLVRLSGNMPYLVTMSSFQVGVLPRSTDRSWLTWE